MSVNEDLEDIVAVEIPDDNSIMDSAGTMVSIIISKPSKLDPELSNIDEVDLPEADPFLPIENN